MKYNTTNNFCDFEFHDSIFEFESFEDNVLVANVKHLNIHSGTKENPNEDDMEIENAIITFENFETHSLEILGYCIIDNEGNKSYVKPQLFHDGSEIERIMFSEMSKRFSLNGITAREENDKITIEIETNSDIVFNAVCSAKNVKFEWDEYCDKAWYKKI